MRAGEGARRPGVAPGLRPDASAAQRVGRFLLARLLVTLGILAVGLYLEGSGRGVDPEAEAGFYGVLVFGFLATALSAATLGRVRSADRFAAVQIAIDLLLVSGLVLVTGGSESIFSIGYALVTIYAAILFESRGAMTAATLSTLAYAAVLFGPRHGLFPSYGGEAEAAADVLLAVWGVHAGALLLVAFLASLLSRELEHAGEVLDRRTSDLEHLRRLHQRTVESLTSGVLTTDPYGRITSFNPAAERITGAPREEVIGRPLDEILPGAGAVALAVEARRRARIRYCNRQGEELLLGLAGSELREDEQGTSGHVLIFQDVTAVVEMEAELRRSERLAAVGQMAADMAHELRNPLAAILGSIQMLEGTFAKEEGDPAQRRLTEIVHRETDRLSALLHDFLQFARPGSPRREPVRLGPVIEETVELFGASKPEGLIVEIDVDPQLRVAVDPAQLRQLLWNLFLNAAQAMTKGGELRIAAAAPEQRMAQGRRPSGRNRDTGEGAEPVEIAVTDTGVGIPPEVLDRIFDPFFTTKPEGSGLGLATVLRIVEAHDGTLRVESRVGEGTTFTIQLPLAEARQ